MTRNFPLAVLLAIREQREEAEERIFAQLNAQLSDVRQVLRRLADELAHQAEARVGQAATVRLAIDHRSFDARWNELRSAEAEMQSKLQALEAKQSAQLDIYVRARCDRETLTELRSQHRRRWESYENLRDQKATGDLFNAKRKRK